MGGKKFMNKDLLLKHSEQLNIEYEPGVSSEIKYFLEHHENVFEFQLKYSDKYFNLEIVLNNYSLSKVKDIFISLVRFIEYTATFYVREDFDDHIEYTLLS